MSNAGKTCPPRNPAPSDRAYARPLAATRKEEHACRCLGHDCGASPPPREEDEVDRPIRDGSEEDGEDTDEEPSYDERGDHSAACSFGDLGVRRWRWPR